MAARYAFKCTMSGGFWHSGDIPRLAEFPRISHGINIAFHPCADEEYGRFDCTPPAQFS